MLSEKETMLLYETLLSSPGMVDMVKIDLRIPRKNILLLAKVIEKGFQSGNGEQADALLQAAGSGCLDELRKTCGELLQKAGLSEMNEKLLTLQPTRK